MVIKVALIKETQYLNLYMIKLIAIRILSIMLLAFLLPGCGGKFNGYHSTNALQEAERLLRYAGTGNTEIEINQRLQAAEQFIAANQLEQAEQLLAQENKHKLNVDNSAYQHILLAQIALAKRDLAIAQEALNNVWTPSKLPESLQIKFYSTRADIYHRSGRVLEAVQERINLARHLTTTEALTANNNTIWEMLSQLTPNTLRLLQNHSKDELNGWVAFANITKQYDSSSEQMFKYLASWKQNFPNHPAISFMPSTSLQGITTIEPWPLIEQGIAETEYGVAQRNLTQPHKIALLLPLQGPHARSAQAVRDGFLAAYYAQKDLINKPKIQIYDTTLSNLQDAYQKAIAANSDFIVGPLIKEEVEAISNSSSPSIPVLALNVVAEKHNAGNIYQFGLSPEMEAQAVAEKAWHDGHKNALIISPKSVWGKRMQQAFAEHWQSLGGTVLATEEIQSQSNLNKEIQHLLAIDNSEARATQLKSLGIKFNFEPRRRQDPDMIFIATNAALARQVKPLLNFYFASRVPTYASSSIFNGKAQPTLDQDLNGIQFCDMPWILDAAIKSKDTYKAVAAIWPNEFDQYARLYALGLDAYKLALQLNQMAALNNLGISGMTGMLTLDKHNTIQRKLMWASFKKGLPYINGEPT